MIVNTLTIDRMIDQVRRGDADAQGRLLEQFRPYLYQLADRAVGPVVRKRSDASDIVQQTFLDACRDIRRFRGTTAAEFSAWLRRILSRNVANVVRDQRAAKRDVTREQSLHGPRGDTVLIGEPVADNQASPSHAAMQSELVGRVLAIIDRLPEDQREAVRLRHLQGWSLQQIASRLDRTPSAAAGLIKRGLEAIRNDMHDIGLM